jgi:hypothetical protein
VLALPLTLNPYVYAVNNPTRYTDPSGEFVDPLTAMLVAGGVGAAVGVGGYLLNSTRANQEFSLRDAAVVGAVGFVAGAAIVSGYGLLSNLGLSMAYAGLGYLGTSALLGTQFCLTDFGMAVAVGALSGLLTPTFAHWEIWRAIGGGILPDRTGAIVLQCLLAVTQYALTEWVHGRQVTWTGLAASSLAGALTGAVSGAYYGAPERDTFINVGPKLIPAWERISWDSYYQTLKRAFINDAFRNIAATFINNAPVWSPTLLNVLPGVVR